MVCVAALDGLDALVCEPTPPRLGGDADDGELLLLVKDGDEAAFARLARRYHSYAELLTFDYFLHGGDRDDLIQVGLVAIWEAAGNYRPERAKSGPQVWVESYIARRIIGTIKHARFARHRTLNQAASLDAPVEESSPAASEAPCRTPTEMDGRQLLRQALRNLG